ncbi:carboxypeptidase M32 [Candidatus Woesearchaeota archaeon]|nr:carboxypeptidase M32 [Candidatus Woesearchaeota archaeon]
MTTDLDIIYRTQRELALLHGVSALLDWDEKTQMPPKAIEDRAEQARLIHDRIHDLMTDDRLWKALRRLKAARRLREKDAHVLRELHKDVERARRVPKAFNQEMVRTMVLASATWQEARKADDFGIYRPMLKRVIGITKRYARYTRPKMRPYDAMLDVFEEGMTEARLEPLFARMRTEIAALLTRIMATPQYRRQKAFRTVMRKEDQEALVRELARAMGIPDDRHVMAVSAHPFTIRLGKDDVRYTTRYNDPKEALLAGIHEAGHALYELNLPRRFADTAVFDTPSLGLHESQSRFWENMVGRSRVFWQGFYPQFARRMRGRKVSMETLYRGINQVRPSFIRVEADEVTYGLHIILRFEIERRLMSGKLSVDAAPKEWNRLSKEMFGITPKTDNEGILQDVHWSMGAIGYFPTYLIGSIYASQIFATLDSEMPDLRRRIRTRSLRPITAWLRRQVHSKGKTMLADEVIRKATGSGLDPDAYIRYLTEKYGAIYGF